MKLNIDTKKGMKAVADIGKKAASSVQKGTQTLVEKGKADIQQHKLEKYNPVFPDVYHSDSFRMPHVIVIANDISRRGIDVCEGAIGWISTEKDGLEILHLYDEIAKNLELHFVPSCNSGAVYYQDSFDPTLFVAVDSIFTRTLKEKVAELQHVAHYLGAKRCIVEIAEIAQTSSTEKKRFSVKVPLSKGIGSAQQEQNRENAYHTYIQQHGRSVLELEGNTIPQPPHLKWFANDGSIQNLIDMRCGSENSIHSITLEFHGASFSTMAKSMAASIDAAAAHLKLNIASDLEAQSITETSSTLLFHVDF